MLPVALNFVARRFSRRCPWFFKPLPMVFSSVGYGLDWMSPYKAVNKKERVCKRNTSSLFVRLKGLEPLRREAPDPKSGVATNYTTAAFGFSLTSAKVRKKSEITNREDAHMPKIITHAAAPAWPARSAYRAPAPCRRRKGIPRSQGRCRTLLTDPRHRASAKRRSALPSHWATRS